MDYGNYYQYIKALCATKKISPSALCAALGITKSSVTRWHDPDLAISLDHAQRLASYFGLDEFLARNQKTIDWMLAIPDRDTRAVARVLWPDVPAAIAADFAVDIKKYADFLMLRSEKPTE